MKIVLFSGTTEGRALSQELAKAGAAVTVCVASGYGAIEQGDVPGVTVRTGKLSNEEKRELLSSAELCVDATHPYAAHVTASVKAACRECGVEYLRLLRPASELGDAVEVEDAAAAARYLEGREGRVLLTTGAKELSAFSGLDPARLYPRVLPSRESLEACLTLGIPQRNIIAMQGPFSRELNAAMLRQIGARFLVTKDGGAPGGFPEKQEAAMETGARLIVLRRPEEDGLSFEEVRNLCTTRIRAANKRIIEGEKQ